MLPSLPTPLVVSSLKLSDRRMRSPYLRLTLGESNELPVS